MTKKKEPSKNTAEKGVASGYRPATPQGARKVIEILRRWAVQPGEGVGGGEGAANESEGKSPSR